MSTNIRKRPLLISIAIVLFFSPGILFAVFGRETIAVMILSVILFFLALPIALVNEVFFNKKNIVQSTFAKHRPPSKSEVILDKLLRLSFFMLIVYLLFNTIVPVFVDVFDLFNGSQPITGEYLVVRTRPGLAGQGFIWQTVTLAGNRDTVFWFYFSPGRVKEGQRYRFQILPNSQIILTATPLASSPQIG